MANTTCRLSFTSLNWLFRAVARPRMMMVLSLDADAHDMHQAVRRAYAHQPGPSALTEPVLQWTRCQTGACLAGLYAGLRNNTLSRLRTILVMAMCARGPWRHAATTDLTSCGRRFRYYLDMIQVHLAFADILRVPDHDKDRFIRRGYPTFANTIVLDAQLWGIANTIEVSIIASLGEPAAPMCSLLMWAAGMPAFHANPWLVKLTLRRSVIAAAQCVNSSCVRHRFWRGQRAEHCRGCPWAAARSVLTLFPEVAPGQLQGQY
jgi:hypothetical protein